MSDNIIINAMYNGNGRDRHLLGIDIGDNGKPIPKVGAASDYVGKKTGTEENFKGQSTGSIEDKIHDVAKTIVDEWVRFENSNKSFIQAKKQYDEQISQQSFDNMSQLGLFNKIMFPVAIKDEFSDTKDEFSDTKDEFSDTIELNITSICPELSNVCEKVIASDSRETYDELVSIMQNAIDEKQIQYNTIVGVADIDEVKSRNNEIARLRQQIEDLYMQPYKNDYEYNKLFNTQTNYNKFATRSTTDVDNAPEVEMPLGKYAKVLMPFQQKIDQELDAVSTIKKQMDDLVAPLEGPIPRAMMKEIAKKFSTKNEALKNQLSQHETALKDSWDKIHQVISNLLKKEEELKTNDSIDYNAIRAQIEEIEKKIKSFDKTKDARHLIELKAELMFALNDLSYEQFARRQHLLSAIINKELEFEVSDNPATTQHLFGLLTGVDKNTSATSPYLRYLFKLMEACKRTQAVSDALNVKLVQQAQKQIVSNYNDKTFHKDLSLNNLAQQLLRSIDTGVVQFNNSESKKFMKIIFDSINKTKLSELGENIARSICIQLKNVVKSVGFSLDDEHLAAKLKHEMKSFFDGLELEDEVADAKYAKLLEVVDTNKLVNTIFMMTAEMFQTNAAKGASVQAFLDGRTQSVTYTIIQC